MHRIKRVAVNKIGLVVTAGLLFAAVSVAQDTTGWEGLSLLRDGQKIEVVDEGETRHRGRLSGISDESIVLRRKGKELSIPRAEVVQVGVRDGSRRWRNVAVIGGVGAGVGLGVGTALLFASGGSDAAGEILAAFTLIGAGAGAGLGATIPGYRTLYRRTSRASAGSPP